MSIVLEVIRPSVERSKKTVLRKKRLFRNALWKGVGSYFRNYLLKSLCCFNKNDIFVLIKPTFNEHGVSSIFFLYQFPVYTNLSYL
jgi:hypothetical protein